mmetsp:Transcript_65250/g.103397  ORF Transcript_65250/g.103397 Transcript_65250/m.103397 type:complete len:82 (-) Transcript_65250:54-299(-)
MFESDLMALSPSWRTTPSAMPRPLAPSDMFAAKDARTWLQRSAASTHNGTMLANINLTIRNIPLIANAVAKQAIARTAPKC